MCVTVTVVETAVLLEYNDCQGANNCDNDATIVMTQSLLGFHSHITTVPAVAKLNDTIAALR